MNVATRITLASIRNKALFQAAQMGATAPSICYTLLRFRMVLAILSLFKGVGYSWSGTHGAIVTISSAGRTTVRAFLRELECLGYIAVESYGSGVSSKYTLLRPLQLTHADGSIEEHAPDGNELGKLKFYSFLCDVIIPECKAEGIDPAIVLQRAMHMVESGTLH